MTLPLRPAASDTDPLFSMTFPYRSSISKVTKIRSFSTKVTCCRRVQYGPEIAPNRTPLKRRKCQPVPMWSGAIHNSQFIIHNSPPATALPSPRSRILNPKSYPTPGSILAYRFPFVKRRGVRFRPCKGGKRACPRGSSPRAAQREAVFVAHFPICKYPRLHLEPQLRPALAHAQKRDPG